MLESKYLTQDGIKSMLQHIYDKGFKYVFFNSERGVYQASQQKPCFEDDTYMYCDGFRQDFSDGFSTVLLNDLLDAYNYIDVLEELNVVDWSQVAVDTPILVQDLKGGSYNKRYFAKYEDGKIYAWKDGTTSWTAVSKGYITVWNYAKLAK